MKSKGRITLFASQYNANGVVNATGLLVSKYQSDRKSKESLLAPVGGIA